MRKLLRAPALHFTVIGALLFALQASRGPAARGGKSASEPIVITAARRAQIRAAYTRETGLPLTATDEKALLDREIREEILYREALAHGLHLNDRSIEWRLASKMSFVASADGEAEAEGGNLPATHELARQAAALGLDRDDVVIRRILLHKVRLLIELQAEDHSPDENALRDYYAKHAAEYAQAERVSFTHVFASRDKRGADAEAQMRGILKHLAGEPITLEEAPSRGDAFALGHRYSARARSGISRIFGEDFADAVMDAEPGRWIGPIRSAHGWHAVWVESRHDERIPELEAVRSRVLQRYLRERREAHLEATVAELRGHYEIVIESDAPAGRG
jgi:hypothetical protein